MADTGSNEFPTILGADANFKGKLEFEKGVRLLGKFEGEITSGGQLLVDNGAALDGDVKAGSIRIDGNVKGNLDAGAKVQLTESARVEGDVHAARLEVGGELHGPRPAASRRGFPLPWSAAAPWAGRSLRATRRSCARP